MGRDHGHHHHHHHDVDKASGQLVTASELSRLTGCSLATITRLSRDGSIPRAVAYDDHGWGLFDLVDDRLAKWVKALRAAGYHRK